jgi:hypothetical protein
MNIKDYDEKIELAFDGQGGYYVKENYLKSVKSNDSLFSTLVSDLKHDMSWELDEYGEVNMEHLLKICPTSQDEHFEWLESYLDDRKVSEPEICGEIAGILFRQGKLKETLEFLEVADMDEPRYWDS